MGTGSSFSDYAKRLVILDFLGGIVGILGGLGAVLFRYAINLNRTLFFEVLLPRITLETGEFNLGLLLLPALGGLIVGPLTMKFAPETKGHGVPEVMEAVALKGGTIRKRVALLKIAVSSITIGSGGSAGREGPIAQIGASVGSLVGQMLKLSPQEVKLLVVCGLSAGIAGTFNAPLGGAIFGLEVLYRGIGLFNAVPVIIASVIGAATAATVLGQSPAFLAPVLTTWNPGELVFYVVLGISFGLLSVVWVRVFYAMEDLFSRMYFPAKFKAALGGLFTGSLIALFPKLGIMGVGYEGVNMALAGEVGLTLLLLLGTLKMLATSFTIGSGGSGGIFAPSLYIGSMFGAAMGIALHQTFPYLVEHPFTYSLAGMGALFAGAAQAPLNVIIMIPEMSGDYALIPPLMASSTSSFLVAWFFLRGSSIYTIKLERRGVKIRMGRPFVLDVVKVRDVMTKNVITVRSTMPVSALEMLFEEYYHIGYPVVDGGKLVGIVTVKDFQKLPPNDREGLRVGDIATRNVVVTYPDETVQEALDKMRRNDVGRLPVVDRNDNNKLVGIVTKKDLLKAVEIAMEKQVG